MCGERSIRQVRFRGSHYERGVQRGRRLRATLVVPIPLRADPAFVQGCFEVAAEAFPPAVDEFEGIVQGGGFDRSELMAHYFARTESQLGGPARGCTMFAITPALRREEGGPIAGRNYDWATADLRWCELHCFDTSGAPRRIGYTHHWAGCADVLSETGLYVAIASLPPMEVRAPGVQWHLAVDMITETCATVEEAARACSRLRHLRPMSYLLADSAGGVAAVEATPRDVRCRRPAGGIVVAANALQGGDIVEDARRAEPPTVLREPILPEPPNYRADAVERARRRIGRALELLRAAGPRLTLVDVRAVLADHKAPICSGDHGEPDGGTWATIWSGVCDPAAGTFSIAPGLPCRHAYQTFAFGGR